MFEIKICKFSKCGKEFSAKNPKQVYCSKKCGEADYKLIHGSTYKRKPPLLPIPCAFCGNEFIPKGARNKYCCADCRVKAEREERTLKKPAEPEHKSTVADLVRMSLEAKELNITYGLLEVKKIGEEIMIKKDCILYRKETNNCIGLNKIYCKKEHCNFYKPEKEYNKDGSKKK